MANEKKITSPGSNGSHKSGGDPRSGVLSVTSDQAQKKAAETLGDADSRISEEKPSTVLRPITQSSETSPPPSPVKKKEEEKKPKRETAFSSHHPSTIQSSMDGKKIKDAEKDLRVSTKSSRKRLTDKKPEPIVTKAPDSPAPV